MDGQGLESPSIAAQAVNCREELEILCDGEHGVWAKEQSAQLNIWIANTGVLGVGHRSLDMRLKDVPQMRALIVQLLCSLLKDLVKLGKLSDPKSTGSVKPTLEADKLHTSSPVEGEHDDSGSSSSSSYKFLSSSEENEEDTAIAPGGPQVAIQETIDRLHRLSTVIRRSGARHREVRIERFLEKLRNRQVHETIERLVLQKAEHLFPHAERFLQKRIAKSIAWRRSRFSYIQQHKQKLSVKDKAAGRPASKAAIPKLLPEGKGNSFTPNIAKVVLDVAGMSTNNQTVAMGHSILSATENTKFDPKRLEPGRNERPETVISAYISQSGFPVPPKLLPGRKDFNCPYCCLAYPASEARGNLWKQHVIRDFEPYFCVFEDCQSPFEPSDSFNSWADHMEECHLPIRWQCSSGDHEPQDFDRKEDLEEHIRSHDEQIAASLLSTLVNHSVRKDTQLFQACPFCGGLPEEVERQYPEQNFEAQIALQKHVRDHLMAIALILPPIITDNVEEDFLTASSPAPELRQSSFDPAESISRPLTLCNQEFGRICDHCHLSIHTEHYQCPRCNGGDYDICMNCASKGVNCQNHTHKWVKMDGKIEWKKCDCQDTAKNSFLGWSTMADILIPIWVEENSAELEGLFPRNLEDPAWPPESQSHNDERGVKWIWPEDLTSLSALKGGWECYRDKVPPYERTDDPVIRHFISYTSEELPPEPSPREPEGLQQTTKRHEIIVGIDFGTIFSRVSWAWSGMPNDIHQVHTQFLDSDASWALDEIPSKICYDKFGSVLKWGSMVRPRDRNKGAFVARHFKLLLSDTADDQQDQPQVRELRQILGEIKKSSIDVITDYFGCLWDHSVEVIESMLSKHMVDNSNFRIIVAVPAVWSIRAQNSLRKAVQIGILANRMAGTTTFSMISEPAAIAIIAFRHGLSDLQVGESFVVCDTGGNSINLISYVIESLDPLQLRTCGRLTGVTNASNSLTDEFVQMVRTLIGNSAFEKLDPLAITRMINRDWENGAKRAFDGHTELVLNIDGYRPKRLGFFGKRPSDKIILTSEQLTAIFRPILGQISDLIRGQVDTVTEVTGEPPKAIIVVGRLSESKYFLKELKASFPSIAMIEPEKASLAISRGAVVRGVMDWLAESNTVKTEPKADQNLVLVMGMTGAGKSYFINKLTRQSLTQDDDFTCVNTPQLVEARIGKTDFAIMDCPGFDDVNRSDTEILKEIVDEVSWLYAQGYKLRGILYLHPIITHQLVHSAKQTTDVLRTLAGDDHFFNVVLVTTKWNNMLMEIRHFEEREKELQKVHWRYMLNRGSTMRRFEGTKSSAERIVADVLENQPVVFKV